MVHDDMDSIVSQDVVNLARERMHSNLAAALLLDWLLTDTESQAPEYFSTLESRFQTGFDYVGMWCGDPNFDGFVPIHGRDGASINFWIHQESLSDLLSRLFPHGANDALSFSQGRALVVVMLHGAVEALFQDLHLKRNDNESVVSALVRMFDIVKIEPALKDILVDLRETRNLIAHHGGRVTKRYRQRVPMTTFAVGEPRLVTGTNIRQFSDAVHRVAERALGLT